MEGRKCHDVKSYLDVCINDVLNPTHEKEVLNIISKIKSSKSCGPNSIPINILKLIQLEICKPLAEVINLSFFSGVHPENLKIVHVKLLFKKGSKLLMSNYRPISLLSNLNNVFEKVMFACVYTFFENSNSLYKLQFGFRKIYSTTHTLKDIIKNINQTLDDKKGCLWCFR